jgi:hypothetical protein
VNDGVTIDAILELLFGRDANVTQNRARELGEEALDEVEPSIRYHAGVPQRLGLAFPILLGTGYFRLGS